MLPTRAPRKAKGPRQEAKGPCPGVWLVAPSQKTSTMRRVGARNTKKTADPNREESNEPLALGPGRTRLGIPRSHTHQRQRGTATRGAFARSGVPDQVQARRVAGE